MIRYLKKLKTILNYKILFLLFLSLFLFRFIYVFKYNNYKEINSVIGKITYIKKDEDKTIIDVKSNNKYRITYKGNCNYELGDIIQVEGDFEVPSNNTVLNGFNYKKYLLSKKIIKISYNPKIKLVRNNKSIIYALKNKVIDIINKRKTSAYLYSFLLADTSYISDDVISSFQKIGIIHLFAISGMHFYLFLNILNYVLKKCKYKNIIIFIFFFLFLFLTNFSISVLRFLISYFLKKIRVSNYLNSIFTFLILLIINPYYIYSIGFWFSNIITFYLILSYKILKSKNYLCSAFLTSTISFLSSLPIIVRNYYEINLISIVLNVVFVPFVSFVIFPLALITFVVPWFDNIFLNVTIFFENLSMITSKINFLSFVIAKPNLILVILYYLFLYFTIKKNIKCIIFYILILIINLNMKYFMFKPMITFIDVNQGDSSIMIFPGGKVIMIDTGGVYYNKNTIVKNKTIPYLNSHGINSIESIVLTHGDYDHMGEAINLVNNFRVEKVIFNCGPYNDLEQELIKVLDKKKIKYYSCIKELNIDKNRLYFLQTKEYDNENDNSNVIYTELDGYKFMFMGDASSTTEKEILSKYNLLNIDVLKVGHHGSKTSSSKEFIDEINPKYSIISVGKNNRYGHPNKSTLENLKKSKIYRTDQDGSIMFNIKKSKLQIDICSP